MSEFDEHYHAGGDSSEERLGGLGPPRRDHASRAPARSGRPATRVARSKPMPSLRPRGCSDRRTPRAESLVGREVWLLSWIWTGSKATVLDDGRGRRGTRLFQVPSESEPRGGGDGRGLARDVLPWGGVTGTFSLQARPDSGIPCLQALERHEMRSDLEAAQRRLDKIGHSERQLASAPPASPRTRPLAARRSPGPHRRVPAIATQLLRQALHPRGLRVRASRWDLSGATNLVEEAVRGAQPTGGGQAFPRTACRPQGQPLARPDSTLRVGSRVEFPASLPKQRI